MGKTKKLLAMVMLALIVITTLSVSSCAKKLTNDEATAHVRELVERSYEINVIVLGEGLPHLDERDKDNPLYAPVIDNEKYKSISDISKEIRQVYSTDYARSLETSAFYGAQSGIEGQALFPRYIENAAGTLCILVDYVILDHESDKFGEYKGLNVQKYDTSTVEIDKITKRFVEAWVTSQDKKTTISVSLIREKTDDGYAWKLNSSTC